ncbi:MAG: hypothetical protein N2B05_00355, partial [Gemmatimonadales bacterium]
MMTMLRKSTALLFALAISLAQPAPAAAQDVATPDPMTELLTELGSVEARIGYLQVRYDDAVGEDRELFADQLSRRWGEHHDLLGEMVTATETAREEGTERLDATERIRLALSREIDFIGLYAEHLQELITELRVARPDTPSGDLFALEVRLT